MLKVNRTLLGQKEVHCGTPGMMICGLRTSQQERCQGVDFSALARFEKGCFGERDQARMQLTKRERAKSPPGPEMADSPVRDMKVRGD
jgi:hypothetical protein